VVGLFVRGIPQARDARRITAAQMKYLFVRGIPQARDARRITAAQMKYPFVRGIIIIIFI